MRQYAKFAPSPVGPALAVRDNGMTVTTTSNALNRARTARSTAFANSGICGCEFVFWGDGALVANIGVTQTGGSISAALGDTVESFGWQLDIGVIKQGNATLVSGLPVISKGEIVGIQLDLNANQIKFYRGSTLLYTRALGISGVNWHFAVSLGSTIAGDLTCAVNSGQMQAVSTECAGRGWPVTVPGTALIRIAEADWLSLVTDAPANVRYEGILDGFDVEYSASVSFWPWGNRNADSSGARLMVNDADGMLNNLLQSGQDIPVQIRWVDDAAGFATAIQIANLQIAQIDVESDVVKSVQLKELNDGLDEPVCKGLFLPNIPALAWRVQPAVIGAVYNVPTSAMNSDASCCWISDRRVYVSDVRDRGDSMESGTWSLDPNAQQVLLTSPPVEPVSVDASSINVGMAPATAQQAMTELMARGGVSAWSLSDAQGLDALGYSGVGYYASDSSVTIGAALKSVLSNYGAAYYRDPLGILRIARLIDPETVADGSLAFDVDATSFEDDLISVPDDGNGLTKRMAFRPNARVMAMNELVTDLVDVPPARRIELTSAYQGQAFSNAFLAPEYRFADAADPFVSGLVNKLDAQREIDRIAGLYTVSRRFYEFTIGDWNSAAPMPGQVARVTYPKYGLDTGKKLLIHQVRWSPAKQQITVRAWG